MWHNWKLWWKRLMGEQPRRAPAGSERSRRMKQMNCQHLRKNPSVKDGTVALSIVLCGDCFTKFKGEIAHRKKQRRAKGATPQKNQKLSSFDKKFLKGIGIRFGDAHAAPDNAS